MAESKQTNRFLDKMLERLFAAMVNGPSLNCRPHSSRQRIDLTQLAKLGNGPAEDVLRALLGEARGAKVPAKVPMPPKGEDSGSRVRGSEEDTGTRREGDKANIEDRTSNTEHRTENPNRESRTLNPSADQRAWSDQSAVLNKLRVIAEEAKTYEQDTGVHVLNIGFPLVSLPVGAVGGGRGYASRRVLSPVAFIPVTLVVKRGASASVEIACRGEGIDLVKPNEALLAWLEQQTGKPVTEVFGDEQGQEPWREVADLVKHVCAMLEVEAPGVFAGKGNEGEAVTECGSDGVTEGAPDAPRQTDTPSPRNPKSETRNPALERLQLKPSPRAEELEQQPTVLMSAVLGLFPMANQGLLRDMQAMAAGEPLSGPVESFVKLGLSLDQPQEEPGEQEVQKATRVFAEERFISAADPCQSRAVKLARQTKGLVVHGPPGTGKSQTITNVIGDHLSRGQRVLLVCDKRTALDVVANRLEHLGLGHLCALVHDPQRDQRELYRAIREQLDSLTEATGKPRAEKSLEKIDAELQSLHEELTRYYGALMRPPEKLGQSFHDLAGQWLAATAQLHEVGDRRPSPQPSPGVPGEGEEKAMAGVRIAELEQHDREIREVLGRAEVAGLAGNPWVAAAGVSIKDFLARPMEQVRQALSTVATAGKQADATADPAIPPFIPQIDMIQQGEARAALVEPLQRVLGQADAAVRARWAQVSAADIARVRQRLVELESLIQTFRSAPLDAELSLAAQGAPPTIAQIAVQLAALAGYLQIADKWYAFAMFGRKSHAAAVLNPFGLQLSVANAQRVQKFLSGLRARLVLQSLYHNTLMGTAESGHVADEVLDQALRDHGAAVGLLGQIHESPLLQPLETLVREAMRQPESARMLLDGLGKSPARAQAIAKLEQALVAAKLFNPKWLEPFHASLRHGEVATQRLDQLIGRTDTLENVLRVQSGLAALPPELRTAMDYLLGQSLEPETAVLKLRQSALAAQIAERLSADPQLQGVDGQRLQTLFDRYRELDGQKRTVVRDAILHRWTEKQKERLLAATGSRLNSVGAELRRRLTLRGERAMRLRQVVRTGQAIEGGDPLFDLRPIWLVSPETVAQVFPRKAMFDVVVFDEASQCRLEEALPVLLRGSRLLVAGDPKQLPPTRFFESAIAQSDDEEAETDQELFEVQQSEIEDLLGAALNLEIEQSYLDVHYRSRNADLIAFSNEQFYGSRLQAIPGHPSQRTRFAPLTLYHVNGVYDKRCNEAEADRVCQIVRDLLKRAKPPSIGIACFNLPQRDLIVEKLDELAGEDATFGKRLAEARTRVGEGSFQGLFVKNLENVQGDERDHIIISTTYGPDTKGKFYQRFGPLGRAGGGRRLNVLVTRAREEVHIVTSIPTGVYRNLPPVPKDQKAGGGWLLFAYLATAERIIESYESPQQQEPGAGDHLPRVRVHPTHSPSAFSEALAQSLCDRQRVGSEVYWGNDGFCVDVAMVHPARSEDVTLGILCDSSRFALAADPVEWDIFRTAIHESQGWKLQRLWTPHFFRDPAGSIQGLMKQMEQVLADDTDPQVIRVTSK